MDYYSILGLQKNATPDQIKSAYRQKVKEHHPDRGGDAEHFKRINLAYETLKDPVKKQEYDNPKPQAQFTYNTNNVNDLYEAFFGRRTAMRRNADIGITVKITLEDVLTGKDIVGRYKLNSGKEEIATIRIPPGIETNVTMRYKGLGDNTITNAPRGDLLVKVVVLAHKQFVRDRLHLRTKCAINVLDLILGVEMVVDKLGGGPLTVKVPKGTNPGTILSIPGYGLPDPNTGRHGNLYLEIKGITPKLDNFEHLEKVKALYDEISNSA